MRLLALETTAITGSIAFVEEGQVVLSRSLPAEKRSAQTLAPTMHEALNDLGWKPQSIDIVAVILGPGSFTGLRVGVTTAKTFAYTAQAAVIGVETLDVLAHQAYLSGVRGSIRAMLDAQRSQLFAAKFLVGDVVERLTPTAIVDTSSWLETLAAGDVVIGPPLEKLRINLPEDVGVSPQELWQPGAAAAAEIAWREFVAGRRDDLWKLAPLYIRQSAAEEKAALKR